MSTVRLRPMTTTLTAPLSWPILTRRSTTASDGALLTVRDCPRVDRRAQSRRYLKRPPAATVVSVKVADLDNLRALWSATRNVRDR
jgi:hypothetical protein